MAQRTLACTALPWQGRPRRPGRLLPAHRGQAGRLPVQPAAEFPRWPPPLRADGAAAGPAVRRLPAGNRAALRVAGPALPAAAAGHACRPAVLQRGQQLALQGDPSAASARLRAMPRRGAHRRRAQHAGPARACRATTSMRSWARGAPGSAARMRPTAWREIARRLAPEDLAAVTAWLAAQPLPADPQPARRRCRPAAAPSPAAARRCRPGGSSHEPAAGWRMLLGHAGGAGAGPVS